MSHVHLLSSLEAQKELTEAVRSSQGGAKKHASWKAASRPSWWVDNHSVTLADGTEVSTGIFDVATKRKWKKSHFQAALFLYEQWKTGDDGGNTLTVPVPDKEEEKIENEIKDEPAPLPRRKRREKKEDVLIDDAPPPPRKKRNTRRNGKVLEEAPGVGKIESEPLPEIEKETRVRTRGRRNYRVNEEHTTPQKSSPAVIPTPRSSQQSPSSSEKSDSPSPVIRKRRTRGRNKVQNKSPLREIRRRKRVAGGHAQIGKRSLRNAAKTELEIDSMSRSRASAGRDEDLRSTEDRLNGYDSDVGDQVRTRRRAHERENSVVPGAEQKKQMSPRLSDSSFETAPELPRRTLRKRQISDTGNQDRTGPPRTPLQERSDPSNLQDRRARKKRRVTDSDSIPSDKENQTPPTSSKSKSARNRSTRGRNGKSDDSNADPNSTDAMDKGGDSKEREDYETAKRLKKEKRIKFLRDQIAKAEAERDHTLRLFEQEQAKSEQRVSAERDRMAAKLRQAYRSRKFVFSKEILDMPMSTFASEHGGSQDEWMVHETEQGVINALQRKENSNAAGTPPHATPNAVSRRVVLTKTARKTRQRLANEATATGLTVRRSQRTAAKVATERTRAIVSCTPRTAKKEAVPIGHSRPLPRGSTRRTAVLGGLHASNLVCTRQQMKNMAMSIKKAENPIELFREFTSQLQRAAFEGLDGDELTGLR